MLAKQRYVSQDASVFPKMTALRYVVHEFAESRKEKKKKSHALVRLVYTVDSSMELSRLQVQLEDKPARAHDEQGRRGRLAPTAQPLIRPIASRDFPDK